MFRKEHKDEGNKKAKKKGKTTIGKMLGD